MRVSASETLMCVPPAHAVSAPTQARTSSRFIAFPIYCERAGVYPSPAEFNLNGSGKGGGPCYARRTLATEGDLERMRRFALRGLAIAVVAAAGTGPLAAQDPGQWGFYSASKGATRYSPLAQINASNVA